MFTMKGIAVCGGIAFGQMAYLKQDINPAKHVVSDAQREMQLFLQAKQSADAQLQTLHDHALATVGAEHAAIFDIHRMMLDDGDFGDTVAALITGENMNAAYAVFEAGEKFAAIFAGMDDAYMQGRAADVRDISRRLVRLLTGSQGEGRLSFDKPVILAAADLSPSETVRLDKDKILAFVTAGGSANSHTAILARQLQIPAVVAVGELLSGAIDGKAAIVDGNTGTVVIEPDAQTRENYRKKAGEEAEKRRLLDSLRGKRNVTPDGRQIDIFANISSVSDVDAALQNDAGGIGLFRSEFLYLYANDYPDEEVQFQAYKTVAEKMAGKKVIVRTLDIGADKQAAYFHLPQEENPALGFRGIRICLDRTDVFKTQLRAIFRASAYGRIAIMFPMIVAVAEVAEVKRVVQSVLAELDEAHIAYDKNVEIGVMIETPAAAMISDLLVKEVDFFSIGTNDLTQYTLAIDRQNQKLNRFYDAHHPAVLRMIRLVADNAHRSGKWVGICGELAADTRLTEMFLAMGIDEFSVSPGAVLPLREKVRAADVSKHIPIDGL